MRNLLFEYGDIIVTIIFASLLFGAFGTLFQWLVQGHFLPTIF